MARANVTGSKSWTEGELEAKGEVAKRLGLRPPDRWDGWHWKAEQDALLGSLLDAELAVRFGRSVSAVRARRGRIQNRQV